MTVEELMEQLKDLPPEMPILVEGYETGYDEIVTFKPLKVFHYRNTPDWDGEYKAHDEFQGRDRKTFPAVAIMGRRGTRRDGAPARFSGPLALKRKTGHE